jgi:hypothetical protein
MDRNAPRDTLSIRGSNGGNRVRYEGCFSEEAIQPPRTATRHDSCLRGTRTDSLCGETIISWQHTDEIPHSANRVVGGVGYRVCAADRVVGAELFVAGHGFSPFVKL